MENLIFMDGDNYSTLLVVLGIVMEGLKNIILLNLMRSAALVKNEACSESESNLFRLLLLFFFLLFFSVSRRILAF